MLPKVLSPAFGGLLAKEETIISPFFSVLILFACVLYFGGVFFVWFSLNSEQEFLGNLV